MITKIKPPHVYLDQAGMLGRGVFAIRAFIRGEVVELSPVFQLNEEFRDLPKEFQHRVFNWQKMAGIGKKSAIALGYGSMYNHSETPNLIWEADAVLEVIRFTARRNIDPNEQLTIHYEQEKDGSYLQSERWFSKKGLDQHEV